MIATARRSCMQSAFPVCMYVCALESVSVYVWWAFHSNLLAAHQKTEDRNRTEPAKAMQCNNGICGDADAAAAHCTSLKWRQSRIRIRIRLRLAATVTRQLQQPAHQRASHQPTFHPSILLPFFFSINFPTLCGGYVQRSKSALTCTG